MGHIIGKDIYKRLGKKIDNLTVRVPLNENFYNILKELYTPDEAEVIVKMPYSLSSFEKVARVTQKEEPRLQQILDSLCSKGLVVDLCTKRKNYYMPAPMIVGIFEMTMMRVGPDVNHKTCAKLFHEYLSEENNFYTANFGHGEKISIMRTLPHEETVADEDYVEFLDYEKATSIVEKSSKFSMGYCSCRHEKFHLGEKECEAPLDNCSSFGVGADYLIRHNMAKEVSKSEMLENIERSRELGLVLTADNVKRNVGFICHCCKCCCNVMTGINKHGYPNTIKTSTFISKIDESKCTACKNV